MYLINKYVRWCWSNDWYVYPVPKVNNQNTVRIEIHKGIKTTDKWGKEKFGTKLIKVGKEEFNQKSQKDKIKIYEQVDEVYKLIYDKYNKK
jgi:hypothetical protein